MTREIKPLAERFWEKVDKNGPIHPYTPHLGCCWSWTRSCDKDGYGRIGEGFPSRKTVRAHRVSYEMHTGPIPVGLKIRHNCDNPPCVNPTHLLCGTAQDNIDDKVKRERQAKREKHGQSKLTEEQVAEIRRDYVYGSSSCGLVATATAYGVSQAAVWYIVKELSWNE